MNRTLIALFLATAVIAGVSGGVAVRLWTATAVFAQEVIPQKVFTAKSFVLVNDAGERRAILSVARDGSAAFRLFDDKGIPRIEIGNFHYAPNTLNRPEGPDIRIRNSEGRIVWTALSGEDMLKPLGKGIE
jgi:hypothetical protein